MQIIDQSYRIIKFNPVEDINDICVGICECYKTPMPRSFEDRCSLVKRVVNRGHESVLEHSLMSVEFTTNRGVTHEFVRHRHTGYSQESTRYCNYSTDRFGNELTFIDNSRIKGTPQHRKWLLHLKDTEDLYFDMLEDFTPNEARDILPNALKTTLLVSTSFREWRSIFKLRLDKAAHYQFRELITPLFEEVKKELPCIFEDIKFDFDI